jgi:hypothetical protein
MMFPRRIIPPVLLPLSVYKPEPRCKVMSGPQIGESSTFATSVVAITGPTPGLSAKRGNENYFPNTFNGLGFDANLDIHIVKVGLNYRFRYGKYPVATKKTSGL